MSDTFENYAQNVVPIGYSAPSAGCWVSEGVTPFPTGYQSKRALYLNDTSVPGGRHINAAAFTPNGGREGSLGRNALRGFGASQFDFTLGRRFKLAGRFEMQLRADAYNVFNHPNFANPSAGLVATQTLAESLGTGGATGGLIPMYQVGGPRSIQLTLKLKL